VLGGPGARCALNDHGLVTTELYLRPGRLPDGVVLLDEARVGRFLDAAPLWEPTTRGHVSLEGFVCGSSGDTPAGGRPSARALGHRGE
jgi:hypothetical protein